MLFLSSTLLAGTFNLSSFFVCCHFLLVDGVSGMWFTISLTDSKLEICWQLRRQAFRSENKKNTIYKNMADDGVSTKYLLKKVSTFIRRPESQSVSEGSRFEFVCEVQPQSNVRVTWIKDGKSILPDKYHVSLLSTKAIWFCIVISTFTLKNFKH